MTKVGFHAQPRGTIPANEERADVRNTAGDNALPLVMGRTAAAYAGVKVVTLADVQRRVLVGPDLATPDVQTAPALEGRADVVDLKLVDRATGAKLPYGTDVG